MTLKASDDTWQWSHIQTHCPHCHHVWIGDAVVPPHWDGAAITADCPKCGCEWTETHERHAWQPTFDPRFEQCRRCHALQRAESAPAAD